MAATEQKGKDAERSSLIMLIASETTVNMKIKLCSSILLKVTAVLATWILFEQWSSAYATGT